MKDHDTSFSITINPNTVEILTNGLFTNTQQLFEGLSQSMNQTQKGVITFVSKDGCIIYCDENIEGKDDPNNFNPLEFYIFPLGACSKQKSSTN